MSNLQLGLTLLTFLFLAILYLLIKEYRGIFRTLERERNFHNHQVGQLLDRIAYMEGKPIPPPLHTVRPHLSVVDTTDEPETLEHDWREV